MAAIGVAQEFAPVFTATKKGGGKAVWFSFTKADAEGTRSDAAAPCVR